MPFDRPHIDVHCHFFNLCHWPVFGVARAYLGLVPAILLSGLVRTLEVLAEKDESLDVPVSELGDLLLDSSLVQTFLAAPATSTFDRMEGEPDLERTVRLLVDRLPDDLVLHESKEIDDFVKANAAEAAVRRATAINGGGRTTLGGTAATAQLARRLRLDAEARRELLASALTKVIRSEFKDFKTDGKTVTRFIGDALKSEVKLVEDHVKRLPGGKLFVCHMMDMEVPYFRDRPQFSYARQVQRMRKLASLYPGRILPFFAYDPYRGDFELFKHAMETGFGGVKIYPPSGYRPTGNHFSSLDAIRRDVGGSIVSGRELDDRLKRVFGYCLQHDIPVLTHCNPGGMTRLPRADVPAWNATGTGPKVKKAGSGLLSDPRGWWQLLTEARGQYANLRLCIGHAGGHDAWFNDVDDVNSSWPAPADDVQAVGDFSQAAYLLTCQFPNVFCDLSHMTEVMDSSAASRLKNRLQKVMALQAGETHKFFDKVMLGTDYFMPNPYGRYDDYIARMAEVFDSAFPDQTVSNRFLIGNAIRYLNLPGFLDRTKSGMTTKQRAAFEKLIEETAP